jgi:hypothetical protein
LKIVSRTRSGVGRRVGVDGKRNFRPRHSPPMIRTWDRPADGAAGDKPGTVARGLFFASAKKDRDG